MWPMRCAVASKVGARERSQAGAAGVSTVLHSAASVALLGITSRATGKQRVNGGVLTSATGRCARSCDLTRPPAAGPAGGPDARSHCRSGGCFQNCPCLQARRLSRSLESGRRHLQTTGRAREHGRSTINLETCAGVIAT